MDGGSAARVIARKAARKRPNQPQLAALVRDLPWSEAEAAQRRPKTSPSRFYRRAGKRVQDFFIALGFLILVGSWLFPLMGLLIRLDSSGPALFRQERIGRRGRKFVCLKFRTMQYAPDAGFAQATREDPRITRVGRFLRKTNLDELPQFINVLRGEMAVVGPRPHVPELDDLFAHQVAGYAQRIKVRPGVTGLAQVSGARGETRSVEEMAQRVQYDLHYIRDCSWWYDLRLVFGTLRCVLFGDDKAY